MNIIKPIIIQQIEEQLQLTLQPAPSLPTPLRGLMTYKENQPKYLLDEQDRLIGLNLAATELDDARWQQIVILLDKHGVQLQALNLCENQLKDFVPPPGIAVMTDLDLDDNPLEYPSPETVQQGKAAVLRFLQVAAAQGTREAFEVKMLIVGEGETGKTTLWNLLQTPDHPVPDEDQKRTVGIQIKEGWEFPHLDHPDTPFFINLWDFGGQEIQYMTHQFFLTRRSFYVLLADGRKEAANFSYWLDIISLLGRDPDQDGRLPLLVVVNEKGNTNPTLPYDSNTVKEQYPGLEIIRKHIDFAEKGGRLDDLRDKIKKILCRNIAHLPITIPKLWDEVRNELKVLRQEVNHIDHQKFLDICNRHGISDRQQQDDLSQFFHDLGLILHFHEGILEDFIVLNPSWAVNAIYTILESEDATYNQGRFNQEVLKSIWNKKGFSIAEQGKLLNLMLKDGLEVCFKAKEQGDEIFIAPQLLPEEAPEEAQWEDSPETLRYIYHYPFMPKGLIGRLIVRLHEDIEDCCDTDQCHLDCRKMVWKNGMYLRKAHCRARVRYINDRKQGREIIQLEVQGPEVEDRRYVLRDIREELEEIHKKPFSSLRFFEKIPCCCDECKKSVMPHEYDKDDLQRMKKKDVEEMRCMQSGMNVPIRQLLDGVFQERELCAEPKLQESSTPVTVNVYANQHKESSGESADASKKPWWKRWWLGIVGVLGAIGVVLANLVKIIEAIEKFLGP